MDALQVLGPIQLRRQGVVLPLPIKKTQALLLLLTGRAPVPRAELVALLWPRLDAATGRRNLRRELVRLRDAGAAGLVLADGDFLVLAPATEVDLQTFASALAVGQPDVALALWRGPLGHGLVLDDAGPFEDWLAQARQRLDGQRLQAMAQVAQAREARHDHAGALQQVELLLAEDPLQEQHHRSAMRLLAALGRRTAALQQFDRCCRVLADELGLAPMAATRDLAERLRTEVMASSVDAAAVVPLADASPPETADAPADALAATSPSASVPASLPRLLPFVGREAEVQALEAAWSGGGPVLLEGEAGVGKSRLVIDFCAAHGPYALVRARPGDAEVPYAVFTRGLRALAGSDSALADLPGWVRAELARLLPSLGPPPPPLADAGAAVRLAQACVQAWTALAADSFDAVLVDDWHHADAASQALLAQVVQSRADSGWRGAREWLLFRPDLGAEARQRLQALVSDTPTRHLVLQALPPEAVFALVQQLSNAQAPVHFARRVSRATGGNPFFIGELLRDGLDRGWLQAGPDGHWRTPYDADTQDYRELQLPASVREAVMGRVLRLPEAAQRVLEAAALASEPFSAALLAPACALSEVEAALALEAALGARLLRLHEPSGAPGSPDRPPAPAPDGAARTEAAAPGGLAFAHDLVQQALEAAQAPERRRLTHRRLALGAEAAGAAPAAIAHHHEAGGDALRAVPWRLAAGDAAERLNALDDAVDQWQRALAAQPGPALALQAHLRLARTRRRQGRLDDALAQVQAIQALAPRVDPALWHDAVAEAACSLITCRRPQQALDMLDALPTAPDAHRGAWAQLRRAQTLAELGQPAAAQAVARPLRAGDALAGRERAELLDTLVMLAWQAGQLPEALDLLAESSRLAAQLGDEIGQARIRYRRATLCLELGDLDGAEQAVQSALEPCRRLGQTANLLALLQLLCSVHQRRGDWARVVATVHDARQPPHGPPEGLLHYVLRTALAEALHALGRHDAAWQEADTALGELLALAPHMQVEAARMLPLGPFVQRGARAALARIAAVVQAAGAAGDADAQAVQAAVQAAIQAIDATGGAPA